MTMTFEEAIAIVNRFERENPNIAFSENAHGVIVSHTEQGFILQLLVRTKEGISDKAFMPELFSYEFEGLTKQIECEVVEKPTAKAQSALNIPVKGGAMAAGAGMRGYGTAGWNFYFNGTLVSLSNWHIF